MTKKLFCCRCEVFDQEYPKLLFVFDIFVKDDGHVRNEDEFQQHLHTLKKKKAGAGAGAGGERESQRERRLRHLGRV